MIVCLDERNGMLFNNRRQSSDRLLCRRVCELTRGGRLWMNGYSFALFNDTETNICVDEAFLEKAGQGDYCFVESADAVTRAADAEELVVFRWNRHYPADTRFPEEQLSARVLVSSDDFSGSSHERITQEVYR